jgi:hypothetical protein
MGVGIDTNAAGIGIPAPSILVRYRSIPVPGRDPLFRYRTDFGIGIFIHSGIRLTGCRTVRHCMMVEMAGGGEGYTLYVCSADVGQNYTCTSTLLPAKMDTPCTSTVMMVVDGYTLHVHTARGGKGYIQHITAVTDTPCTSTLFAWDRDTPSRPHCCMLVERKTPPCPHC